MLTREQIESDDIPPRVPIALQRKYDTARVGGYGENNLFAGFLFVVDKKEALKIAVLHHFDGNGAHTHTEAWNTRQHGDVEAKLDDAIADLESAEFKDIAIQPFKEVVFGIEFGLIQAGPSRIDYMPLYLMFVPPWNGLYCDGSP